ncbi:MAG: hypothetical protein KGZ33_03380 [Alkaliphilus sp.]|nr:hypothetical protein [Alkaliphilus sp.]
MEDKTFELLTKMYSQFTEKFESLENGQKRLEDRVGKIETLMENEFKSAIQAALEGYQTNYEKLKEHDSQLESIKNTLEKQNLEITVIKGGKQRKLK